VDGANDALAVFLNIALGLSIIGALPDCRDCAGSLRKNPRWLARTGPPRRTVREMPRPFHARKKWGSNSSADHVADLEADQEQRHFCNRWRPAARDCRRTGYGECKAYRRKYGDHGKAQAKDSPNESRDNGKRHHWAQRPPAAWSIRLRN